MLPPALAGFAPDCGGEPAAVSALGFVEKPTLSCGTAFVSVVGVAADCGAATEAGAGAEAEARVGGAFEES